MPKMYSLPRIVKKIQWVLQLMEFGIDFQNRRRRTPVPAAVKNSPPPAASHGTSTGIFLNTLGGRKKAGAALNCDFRHCPGERTSETKSVR